MLSEDSHVRQPEGEPPRRWFSDDYFDLIVWLDRQESSAVRKAPSTSRIKSHESRITRKVRSMYGTNSQEEVPARIIGFQLCYDKTGVERALTWHQATGYTHHRIDLGEEGPKSKRSPILIAEGELDHVKLAELFREHSTQIDPKVAQFVYEKVSQFQSSTEPDDSA